MSIKVAVTALLLILPSSFAMACSNHSKQTQSCAVGTVWDADMQKCTTQITG